MSGLYLRSGELVEQRPWSDQELAEAIKLRRGLHSATQIGKHLGRPRNSVIAKLWREDEPGVLANQNGLTGHGPFSDAKPRAATRRVFSWETANG